MTDDADDIQTEFLDASGKTNPSVERYVPASIIPNYSDFCPILKLEGYLRGDGSFFTYFNDDLTVPAEDLIQNPGYLVLEIGGVEVDYTASSAAHAMYDSLVALFAGCNTGIVQYERIRTTVELSEFLKKYRCNYSHIILIGHGGQDGIKFLDKISPIRGNELRGLLGADNHKNPIQIISLCCYSGSQNIAQALSKAEGVTEVLAPSNTFDLRWSVHFILGYFLNIYLSGKSLETAVCDAAQNKVATPMSIWREGVKIYQCKIEVRT